MRPTVKRGLMARPWRAAARPRPSVAFRHLHLDFFAPSGPSVGKTRETPCDSGGSHVCKPCPISHVPVAACWSVGIRTRGRTAARDSGSLSGDGYPRGKDPGDEPRPEQRPAAGGETGEPRSPRGTQLKATTDRAFLVSAGFQIRRLKRLVHLARRAVGVSPFQTKAASRAKSPSPLVVSPSHGRRDDSSPLSRAACRPNFQPGRLAPD